MTGIGWALSDHLDIMQPANPPAINLPAVVTITAAVLALIHAARALLDPQSDFWLVATFSFIPARYSGEVSLLFPGGLGADIWTFISYGLLHADITHIFVNLIWLVAFGGAVAKRFGTIRFLVLSIVATAAGALAHLVSHWGEFVPIVGASAAISGYMGAAIRFALAGPGLFRRDLENLDAHLLQPASSLFDALRERRVLAFLAVWFGVNLLFGVGTLSMPGQEGSIAWQAHIGGFLAGLLGFRFIDPVGRAA